MITFKAKRFRAFFNKQAVKDVIGKKRAKFLRNAGGYIQRTAQRSMKRVGMARKPPKKMTGKAYLKWLNEVNNMPASPAGSPPNVHTTDKYATLKWIEYEMSPRQSLFVGSVALNGARGAIPGLHEHGGSQVIREKMIGRKWFPVGRTQPRPGQPARRRMAKYPARPFMKPAVQKTASTGKFNNLWVTS